MQQNINFRLITEYELRKVNPLLEIRFGLENVIASGSCVKSEGKIKYHVALKDTDPYKTEGLLKNIGGVIKNVLGADEVYLLGRQIA